MAQSTHSTYVVAHGRAALIAVLPIAHRATPSSAKASRPIDGLGPAPLSTRGARSPRLDAALGRPQRPPLPYPDLDPRLAWTTSSPRSIATPPAPSGADPTPWDQCKHAGWAERLAVTSPVATCWTQACAGRRRRRPARSGPPNRHAAWRPASPSQRSLILVVTSAES